MDQLYLI
jgi:serine/threonine protein kinase